MGKSLLIEDLPTVPNVLAIKDRESLDGYLLRVSNANGLMGLKELLRPIPGYSSQRSTGPLLNNIAVIVGQKEEDLTWHCTTRQNTYSAVHEQFCRMQSTPVCPGCLKEHGFSKRIWQHIFATACPEHGKRLIDTCDDCGTTITKDRAILMHCNCGRDLRDIKSAKVGAAERWFNLKIEGLTTPLPPMSELGNTTWQHWENFATLAEFLGANLDLKNKKVRGWLPKPKTVEDSVAFLETVLPFFEDFPNHLSNHIKERLAVAPPNVYSASVRLGYWFSRLQHLCGWGRYTEFVDAARDAVTFHADGKYHLTEAVANLDKSRFLTLAPAARFMGTTSDTLLKLVSAGKLQCVVIPHTVRSKSVHFEKFALQKAKEACKDGITKSDVMKMTGLGKKALEYFLEYGLFKKTSTLALELNPLRFVSKKSVEGLKEILAKAVKPQAGVTIKLKDFGLRMTTNKPSHRQLYLALADGRLKPVVASAKLGDFEFLADDVKAILASSVDETLLKIVEVSKALKVKDEVVRSWVKQGLLRNVSSSQRGQAVSLIPVSALAEFQAKYAVVSELAKQAGTSSKQILENFEQRKIPTVGSYEITGGVKRGYLVEIKALFARIV